jgi:hypothetical protein
MAPLHCDLYRLERLRRREEEERGGGAGAELEDTPHDSAESSVEGIFLSGVRSLHPFKVRQCGVGQRPWTGPMMGSSLHPFKQCGGRDRA